MSKDEIRMIEAKARAKALLDSFEAIHKLIMQSNNITAIDALESAQLAILLNIKS